MLARALPWLLCLPALLFATPLSPLADDPYPHLAGTGWAVLALVPLALLALARGASLRSAWPFTLVLLWALFVGREALVSDTFEARRALLGFALPPLALAGGARLDERGRVVFQGLLVALALAWSGYALARGFAGDSFAGVLGDTGSLSQAALGGAAVGAAWLARAAGARRVLGGATLGLFLVHVAAAPVLAGAHTLLAGLLLVAWLGPARGRGALLGLALVALLAPFAGMAVRQGLAGAAPTMEGAPAEASHSLRGLGVRGLVWTAALGLLGEHPLVGAGPGQFQAAFPPHRDPQEIELSRHGVCSELDTEVEHAHNDWLQGACELGLVGGLLWIVGLARIALDCARALRDPASRDDGTLPLALAASALLVNAFVHSPLLANPASAALAFALFGAAARRPDERPGRAGGLVVALPVLGAALFALPLVRHGAALCDYVRAARAIDGLRDVSERQTRTGEAVAAIERARAAAPDAAPARLLTARLLAARTGAAAGPGAEGSDATAAWDAVLALRPHSVEAWEQSGTLCARAGRTGEARERYGHALALSPSHPRILRNAARLECTQGELARGLAHVEALRGHGCLDEDWLRTLGDELVLVQGRPERGARLLFSRALSELVPEELHAQALEEGRDPLGADARECLAQFLWARGHAAAGRHDVALRNYRQALDRSRARSGPGSAGAPLYRCELGAAELLTGHAEEAREHLALPPASDTWAELPAWAQTALEQGGLASGR